MENSTREISDWIEENLGNPVSADTISAITDRVIPEIKTWKSRMLDSVYSIVLMYAIHYKVTDERVMQYLMQSIMCWKLIWMVIKSFLACIYLKIKALTSGLVSLQIFRILELNIF